MNSSIIVISIFVNAPLIRIQRKIYIHYYSGTIFLKDFLQYFWEHFNYYEIEFLGFLYKSIKCNSSRKEKLQNVTL